MLRRAMPFRSPAPTREWQEASDLDDYEKRSTLPEIGKKSHPSQDAGAEAKSPNAQQQQQQHKTVIYFGDSTRREKQRAVKSDMGSVARRHFEVVSVNAGSRAEDEADGGKGEENSGVRVRGNEGSQSDPPSDIVISVKPGREDVLKIEEDESRIEDYWALPGDTTGFRADWSFVQQWRMRG